MYYISHVNNAPLSSQTDGGCLYIRNFLLKHDLYPDTDADFTVCLYEDEDEEILIGTGSIYKNVLKYIAVDDSAQGTGAAAQIINELTYHAYYEGIKKLFLFTKPKNESMFRSLGFYTLAKTEYSLMMETDRCGLDKYLNSLEKPENPGVCGAIVANCNPMTLGHRYLFETAASLCDTLHIFILSEDRSFFPADVRYNIVKEETADIKNIYIHKSGDYMISSATFPTYFIKDKANAENINADLDLTLFGSKIAPYFGITKRFVGTEPFCPVTHAYNQRMKIILPEYDVEVCEIERKDGISASLVRKFMQEKNFDEIKKLVPCATYRYIIENYE